jgi:PTS system mannose-specific IIA component
MVGIILISENKEAPEMLKTVHRLLGRTKGITCVILKSKQTITQMQARLKEAIEQVDAKKGVLLLTDIYGSTQCNVCMKFIKSGSVELLTGFNLPMLVKLGILHETIPFKNLIPFIEEYGKKQIRRIANKRAPCS